MVQTNDDRSEGLEIPPTLESFDMVKQLTIIGRGECGKTSILKRFFKNEFSEDISATPIENEDFIFSTEGKKFKLKIWDTSGQEDFSRFRTLTLPMSDYVIICYSITDPMSFYEVEDTLIPMVKQKAREDVNIMLVATKIDKRNEDYISTEEGIFLAKKIGAFKFIECSSLTGTGIKEVFNELKTHMTDLYLPRKGGFISKMFCCTK